MIVTGKLRSGGLFGGRHILAVTAVVVGALVLASSAGAFGSRDAAWKAYYNTPSNEGTWEAFCNGGGGRVAARGDGVMACGPTGGTSIEIPGGISTPGFQCVELTERFLYITHGWTTLSANGAQIAKDYAAAHGVPLISNGTAGVAPHVGDVMSFSQISNFSDTGHTGVVTASSVDSSGNGTITLLSENVGFPQGTGNSSVVRVSGWHVADLFGEFPYTEWIQSGAAQSQRTHTSAGLIPRDGASGYVLDGYGNLHAFGNAPAVSSTSTWPGWDIARAVAVTAPGKGYILDGYGGVHPFGGAPALADPAYWGWDIGRGLALCPGGKGGYVLDGWGGLHPIGNASNVSGGPYWPGWDIARGVVVNSTCAGGYVLDGYGGVHPFGNAPAVNSSAYWGSAHWDIARSITLVSNDSGYVLDGYGGIHPFAANGTPMPPAPTGSAYEGGSDVYRSLVIDPVGGTGVQVSAYEAQAGGSVTAGQVNVVSEPLIHTSVGLIPRDGASGYVLDGYGNLHAFGNAPAVSSPSTWPGWDIARGIAVTAPGKGYILDGYGGLHAFGGAPALYDPTYWGWDIARGIALCPGGGGGYVLDGWGGIHPVGNAKPLSGGPYWPGWDIARGIVVNSSCTGGYVLEGYGGVHSFGNAPGVGVSAYWGPEHWDIARSITLVSNSSGYVLDGYGGIHPFAATGAPMPPGLPNSLYDPAQTDPFDAFVYSPSLKTGIAVTRSNSNGLFWTAETS